MTLDARDSPTVQRLLARVPEFKPTFDQFVREEQGEFGSFWAVNELHRWAFPNGDPDLLKASLRRVRGGLHRPEPQRWQRLGHRVLRGR
ncbi:MAG: hypothetical protein ACRDKY_08270, partial [Solirubrobacteraceae bacterium]